MQPSFLEPSADSGDVFDEIREGFRFVADHARLVRLREDRLMEYALTLQPFPPANTLDDEHHYSTGDAEALAAYYLSLDAVNFGSGYTADLVAAGWALTGNSIYFTVSTALKDEFSVRGPWTPEALRALRPEEIRVLFRLPDAPAGHEVAALFVQALNELGAFVAEEYNGRFMDLIAACRGRASGLVTRLAALPGFADMVQYRGQAFPVYKRAQHATASLHGAFSRIGQPLFSDIDRLTMFADNAVPHVLHVDGILEYDTGLAARIAAGGFLDAGSEAEIEIRCCAGQAVERLAAIKGMKPVDLDYLLWHRSVEDARYDTSPAHNTRTRHY